MNNCVLFPSQPLFWEHLIILCQIEWFLYWTLGLHIFNREGFNTGNWAYKTVRRIEGAAPRLLLKKQLRPRFDPPGELLLVSYYQVDCSKPAIQGSVNWNQEAAAAAASRIVTQLTGRWNQNAPAETNEGDRNMVSAILWSNLEAASN